MAIEFRVQGKDSAAVGQELAGHLKVRFQATPVVRDIGPSRQPAEGADAKKFDPLSGAILVVEVVVTSVHAYMLVRERREAQDRALVRHWTDLVIWANSKLPTTIRALIGKENLLLHESDPERLHHLTKKEIDAVKVTVEGDPGGR